MSTSTSRVNQSDGYEIPRARMVEQLRSYYGIKDERVLDAMNRIPRHAFVPEALKAQAYKDNALPIAAGQTISQPFIVARMTELLELNGRERVLEIGSGSGYQTAVLALLAKHCLQTLLQLWLIHAVPLGLVCAACGATAGA